MKSNLFDSPIILLSSATLPVFILWAVGELTGIEIFANPPEFLRAADNLFQVLVGGTGLYLVLYAVRRQISGQTVFEPNDVLHIVRLAALFVALFTVIVMLVGCSSQRKIENTVQASVASLGDEGDRQFKINGAFFFEDSFESIILRHESDESGYWDDEVTFFRGNHEIGRFKMYRISVEGLCRSPDTSRLSLLINAWPGTPTIPGGLFAATFNRPTGLIVFTEIFDVVQDERTAESMGAVKCTGEQKIWPESKLDGPAEIFIPCDCRIEEILSFDYFAALLSDMISDRDELEIEGFPASFLNGEGYNLNIEILDDEKISNFLRIVSELPAESSLSVNKIESPQFVIVAVTYSRGVWDSYQYIIVKDKNEQWDTTWRAIYSASYSSKSPNVAKILGFDSPAKIRVEMCIHDCQWWGLDGIVEIDLQSFIVRYIEH